MITRVSKTTNISIRLSFASSYDELPTVRRLVGHPHGKDLEANTTARLEGTHGCLSRTVQTLLGAECHGNSGCSQ